MTRPFALLAAFAVMITAVECSAQGIHRHPSHGHDYWHHDFHTPDVVQLDAYADQLAKVARHLHEDAHQLSQDYEHSESIERYVDNVDRLQQHLHEILHGAVESGYQSSSLFVHAKNDVRQVRSLMGRLYRELEHQGYDGARTQDFHAIAHMRQVIVQEAYPLIRQMETELYGYALDRHSISTHRRPIGLSGWPRTHLHH